MLVHLCKPVDVLKEEPEPHLHDGSGEAAGYGYSGSTGDGSGYAQGGASKHQIPWNPSNGSAFHDHGRGGGIRQRG